LRFGAHPGAAWTAYAAKITVLQRYSDREMAADAELAAIRDEDPVFNLKGRACQRCMQWMMAYPDRHADDITTREQLDEAVCDVNRLATQWFSRRPQLQRD